MSYRLIRHVIGGRPPFRMPERNQRVGEGVSADDQSVATVKLKGHVALRVAWCVDQPQAGDDLVIRL